MNKKIKKVAAVILGIAAIFWVAMAIENHRADRMIAYANEHNCSWYNVTTEPVCK